MPASKSLGACHSARTLGTAGTARLARSIAPVIERLEQRALFSAGQADPTFAGGGLVLGFDANLNKGYYTDLLVQPDGKILAQATTYEGGYGYNVFRFNADGTP